MEKLYLTPHILWDIDEENLYIGMHNKELAYGWIEYFSCTELLPVPLKLQNATVIEQKRIRQEITTTCSLAIALEMIATLKLEGLDLTKIPPQFHRSMADAQRGDEMKVLFNDTLSDRRIGKVGVIRTVHQQIQRLDIEFENLSTLTTNPNWVVKIGHRSLPPLFHWLTENTIIWQKHLMFANGEKTNVEIRNANSKTYQRQQGIPDEKPFAHFIAELMVNSFTDSKEAKSEAELLFTNK